MRRQQSGGSAEAQDVGDKPEREDDREEWERLLWGKPAGEVSVRGEEREN